MIDVEAMEQGIDSDGRIEDPYQEIETYYCRIENILSEMTEAGEWFFRITGDNGGTNVEMRLPFAVLVANGWTAPELPLEALPEQGGDHANH